MAEYPSLSASDLSEFSGRDISLYPVAYSETALSQARLLFKIGTCLAALPDDEDQYQLALNAILDMAEWAVLSQPYGAAKASPFTSESIGSYSYSKAVDSVRLKENTGRFWFDLAVRELSVCEVNDSSFFFGGIENMEHQGIFTTGAGGEGNIRYLSPSDLALSRSYGVDLA